jgi:hypothetical protein
MMSSGADAVPDRVLDSWTSLPRRIHLDTSILQNMHNFGDAIWEGERFQPVGRAAKVDALDKEIEALRKIMLVNERASFQLVVTEASLREVVVRHRRQYTRWVYDVLDTWLVQSEGEEPHPPGITFDDRRFGMISVKDRRLLQDALDRRCEAFLTMERRLPTAAEFIKRETGLRVMRPKTYWDLLAPWAALYYLPIAIPLGCSIPALSPLATVRSHSFRPRPKSRPAWVSAAVVSTSSSAPSATS